MSYSKHYTFSLGTEIDPVQVNQNTDDCINAANTNLGLINTNLASITALQAQMRMGSNVPTSDSNGNCTISYTPFPGGFTGAVAVNGDTDANSSAIYGIKAASCTNGSLVVHTPYNNRGQRIDWIVFGY